MDGKWVEVTEMKDELPVFMHVATGQTKMVKPAAKPARTILDDAYDDYWNSPSSRPDPSNLLAAVRSFTLKMTRRDEDVAQTVCLIVFEGLETFSRADETAFTRWVRSIIRRVSLEAFRTNSAHTKAFEENATEPQEDEHGYVDVSRLNAGIRVIAEKLLEGYSLTEIAWSQNVTSATLRKRLQRYRKSVSRN